MILYCNNIPIIRHVIVVDTFTEKFFGLMGKKNLDCDEGLMLMHCSSIHCFFMKIPIDAVYLSKGMRILGMETISPWHVGKRIKNTVHVLELKAGISHKKFAIGEELVLGKDTEKITI